MSAVKYVKPTPATDQDTVLLHALHSRQAVEQVSAEACSQQSQVLP